MLRLIIAISCFFFSSHVFADATIPKADIAGAKDSPFVGRFAGSYIVSYEKTQETLALLKILALGRKQVAEGKVTPMRDVIEEMRKSWRRK